ncbi:MAG: class I SAM-dependent methyltransferase [Nitrososphaera sp.]|nr:class I SAM-dependent methyltransferase [Nitrososphaera sp.]
MTVASYKPYELKHKAIRQLVKLAGIKKNDVFYDLGCASGKVVIELAKNRKIKRAVGVDNDPTEFPKAWLRAFRELRANRLWYVDFRLADIQDFQYGDATVIYQGTDEDTDTVSEYSKRLGSNKVRIITKDLPLVGYLPEKSNQPKNSQRLFITEYPLTRASELSKWIKSILGNSGTVDMLYRYYYGRVLSHYPNQKQDASLAVRDLKRLVIHRFRSTRKARKNA